MFGDWHQLWEIISNPDNVPVVALLFLVPFFTWFGLRQAHANDRLIAQLEADPEKARTHHRKTQPYHPSWPREVHVWPYLLRVELLAAVIVTIILTVWALTVNAPLEEPANASITMNPAKAPWYFLGLQEMLEYFDPWIAGVVMPTLIIFGLMAIPFIDANPLGNGYYTYRQRRFAIWTFLIGFEGLWLVLIMIGTFLRGPGFMLFWPTQTWDPDRIEFMANRNLDDLFGIDGRWLAHPLPAPHKTICVIWGVWPDPRHALCGGSCLSVLSHPECDRVQPQDLPTHESASGRRDGVLFDSDAVFAAHHFPAAGVSH